MRLQVIQDGYGKNTGIFVPINDWEALTEIHKDLKDLVQLPPIDGETKKTMKDFRGILSNETADNLRKQVEISRNEWEEWLGKQF